MRFSFAGGKTETRAEINKKLGVFSNFQIEHGFYADALGLATVVLPNGWRERLQPILDESGETIAYAAEIHDVAVSKLIAGREKDFQFLIDAFRLDIISVEKFVERVLPVIEMPQSAVLIDRLEKLEKHLLEKKSENRITALIRDVLKELRKKL